MNFEDSVKRLEEIVTKLESGDAKLNEVDVLFTEGADLVKKCYKLLDDSKGKITVLRQELSKYIEEPMDN